ncbi:serine/threonine-protein kinase VRK3 isoform X2 [Myripristis murdjan]|uniref:VRK serine/threonine kinase 3 n=1 Tax=Myripristis murdjan TaxID=586833 RepID=A0A667W8D2_9TELE|nr:inactive serine/threonine-protein kinase VRK3 isoform X2 [Myripristis murdjan]
MPFRFCPQCGTELQPHFQFCPSCGEKLPCPADTAGALSAAASSCVSALKRTALGTSVNVTSLPSSSTTDETTDISPRPPLRKTRNSLQLDAKPKSPIKDSGVRSQASPAKRHMVIGKVKEEVEPALKSSSSPVSKPPGRGRGKVSRTENAETQVEEGKKLNERTSRKVEESAGVGAAIPISSPLSSPVSRSPSTAKGKAKKAKRAPAVELLEEGECLTDTTGRQWKLVKLLSQNITELIYEVSPCTNKGPNHIVKLGAKEGRIFNEQNFLQRAAKHSSVEKWMKHNKMDFLGIPSCVAFGSHTDSYRFLIFPAMGQSLQSIMEDGDELLPEKAILQIGCRLLDALEYIHSNEYVHADVQAENIYIMPGEKSQVYLAGYCYAFRYCPSGVHVEYREASRSQHEGAIQFISLDAHKGAAPSRRSDLQSLGYCMLCWHTGALPWNALTNPDQVADMKNRYMDDVPALLSHCFGKKRVSRALQAYLGEVMALQYSEQPDYAALKAGLCAALQQLGGALEQPLSL